MVIPIITNQNIFFSNSINMTQIKEKSIDLVVCSPPYPMINMWDHLFQQFNPILTSEYLENNPYESHKLMHEVLNGIWDESISKLKDGGIICINIGDATRNIHSNFHLFNNSAPIISYFISKGLIQYPSIIWNKPNNAPNKFMGSGMIPTNAYVTLEHEMILIFRKGKSKRSFPPKDKNRYNSAFFWEERNIWFSDKWNIVGSKQSRKNPKTRERSANYPLEIPLRLINMYSIYGDTILDPFLGTGTTIIASSLLGRNSYGYEIDHSFKEEIMKKFEKIKIKSKNYVSNRIKEHLEFIQKQNPETYKYNSFHYSFPLKTKQEMNLKIKKIDESSFINQFHELKYEIRLS